MGQAFSLACSGYNLDGSAQDDSIFTFQPHQTVTGKVYILPLAVKPRTMPTGLFDMYFSHHQPSLPPKGFTGAASLMYIERNHQNISCP